MDMGRVEKILGELEVAVNVLIERVEVAEGRAVQLESRVADLEDEV